MQLPSSGCSRYPWPHRVVSGDSNSAAWNDGSSNIGRSSWKRGVSSSEPELDPRAVGVVIDDDDLTVELADGRRVSIPLRWYPRLLRASAEQRRNWRFIGDGLGIRWPDVDEDLSVCGLLRGAETSEPPRRAV